MNTNIVIMIMITPVYIQHLAGIKVRFSLHPSFQAGLQIFCI